MKTIKFKIGDWGFNPNTKEYIRFNTDFDLASWNISQYEDAKLKKFDTYYVKNDEELPYIF